MAGGKQEFSKFAKQLWQEFSNFSDKCADAAKDGANHSVGKLMGAVDEFVEPSSVLIEKLTTAVKNGKNEQIVEAVDGLIEPSSIMVRKFAIALKDGTNIAGEKMITALEEAVKPAPIDAKTLADAVKVGTNYAGDKMMSTVDDLVQMFKASKARKR
jgi:hypothetical protein